MMMHNPPHPGEFIKETYLEPYGLSIRYLAEHLKVAPSTINRLMNKASAVSPEMALRLSITLGRSPESWLEMQAHYDLFVTKKPRSKRINFENIDDAA